MAVMVECILDGRYGFDSANCFETPAYILYHTVPGFARVCMELSTQLVNSDRFYGAYDLHGLQAQRFK